MSSPMTSLILLLSLLLPVRGIINLPVDSRSDCTSSELYVNDTQTCHHCHCAGTCDLDTGCIGACADGYFDPPQCQNTSSFNLGGCGDGFYIDNLQSGIEQLLTGICTPCHCRQGCEDGFGCTNNKCAHGWKEGPRCDQPCLYNKEFGYGCQYKCHCPEGSICSSINGLCTIDGTFVGCHEDWTGPGCQLRLPKLTDPPVITDVYCGTVNLTFTQWRLEYDIGEPEIGKYEIYSAELAPGTTEPVVWQKLEDIPYVEDAITYHRTYSNLNQGSEYIFMVVSNRTEFGGIVRGGQSPKSEPVRPICTTSTSTTSSTTTLSTITPTTTTTPTTTATTTTTPTTTTPPTTTMPTTTTPTTTTPTTTTPPTEPGLIGGVSVEIDPDSGQVSISWDQPDDGGSALTGYKIVYQVIGVGDCDTTHTETPITVNVGPSELSTTLSGLRKWRRYRVSVSGVNSIGEGEPSHTEVLTLEEAPSDPPTTLALTSLGPTSLELNWDQVACAGRGGQLVSYQVEVSLVSGDSVGLYVVSQESAIVNNLTPYVQYSVRVRMSNSVGSGPYSDALIRRTSEAAPPSPQGVSILEVTDVSIAISWSAPQPTYGILQNYRIIYSQESSGSVELSVTQGASEALTANLTELLPNTHYQIQVQASTNAGWGNLTTLLLQQTSDGVPSAPGDIYRRFRNTSCLFLEWEAPSQPNGAVVRYQVSYTAVASFTSVTSQGTVETPLRQYNLCGLYPAVQYRVNVRARTNKGVYGEAVIANLWTEVGTPNIPPRPAFVFREFTYITIQIGPVFFKDGPISGYFIVVDHVVEENARRRRRRSTLPDPTVDIPLSGYTTAFIAPEDLTHTTTFVVGDDKTYGEYQNRLLENFTHYHIAFVVASSLDGVTKFAFSQMADTVYTGPTPPPTTTTTTIPESTTPLPTTTTVSTSTTTTPPTTTIPLTTTAEDTTAIGIGVIIGIVLAFLILIILLIIIIICCWRKNSQKQKEKGGDKAWLTYYTKNYQANELQKDTKQGMWTDTFNLEENRKPIINQQSQYSPVDLQVSDIHHNRPKILFDQEYRNLPHGQKFPWKVAMKRVNKDRNRFDHILAYDHSRVVLQNRSDTDYINANYVQGYNKKNAYIAAQSPFNTDTVYDFWYMIYQEDVTQVLFIARLTEDGIIKSEQYWPDAGAVQYKDIVVRHIETELYADFVVRVFDVLLEGKSLKRVTQYHFTLWPDHGVPDDPIPLLFYRLKVKMDKEAISQAPVLVHCGTGVSRSAVYIALDSLLEEAKVEHSVNIFKFCNTMRHCRVNMIRTLKQYVFLYDALFEALMTNYNLIGDNLKVNYRQLSKVNPVNDKSYFREQFEVLEKYTPALSEEECQAGLLELNKLKNRFSTIIPPDVYRPVLKTPGGLGRTDYINALFVDSYLSRDSYIVTQTPAHNTVIDFWKMIYDYKVSIIVMLNNMDFREESCVQYWPDRKGQQKWEPFFVNLVEEYDEEHYTVRTLRLVNATKPNEEPRQITHFQFESWKMYEKTPWSRDGFIQLMEAVEDEQDAQNTYDQPVVIHCMDGANQSGLYCACAVICEIIREEDEVDVFHVIKHIKRRRPHFVNSLEQYKFVFKLLWDYLNTRLERKAFVPNDEIDEPTTQNMHTMALKHQQGLI